MESNRPPRVILASSSVGAGHNQAALALRAGLAAARPALAVEFVDTLQHTRWLFRHYYVGTYEFGVARWPRAYGWSYDRLNRPATPRRTLFERTRLAQERFALRHFRRWLLAQRPALVVATHFLPAGGVSGLLARGAQGLRLLVVVTDNEAHRFWFAEHAARYFVPNENVPAQLARWGIAQERVSVTGIPVHPKWTAPVDRAAVRRAWQLPADRPIVLVSGGTYFVVGPMQRMVRGILDGSDAHVVVLCGNNKGLLADLAKFPEAGARLTGVPFTDKGHELSEVASIFVTKPGGLTTSEALALGKPLFIVNPIPGQETANSDFLLEHGAAIKVNRVEDVAARLDRLVGSPRLLELSRNAKALGRPAAASTICEEVVRRLDG
jgi:processive 1,2-diacylglycerol beta-glucosyltransferase